MNGLNDPNAYGDRPLVNGDPAKPNLKDGPANDYWDHVDYIIGQANQLGLYIGFLPSWGDKWNPKWARDSKVIFTVENAETYGKWIGERYKDKGIPDQHGGVSLRKFDESFVILAMVAPVEAIFLSTFVLITQNHMAPLAEQRAELGLQVSLLAEHEITRLMHLGVEIGEQLKIPGVSAPDLEDLKRDVHPERVLDKIQRAEQRKA